MPDGHQVRMRKACGHCNAVITRFLLLLPSEDFESDSPSIPDLILIPHFANCP